MERVRKKQKQVPTAWVEEKSRTASLAERSWRSARAEADFQQFEPHLASIVGLCRDYSGFFAPNEHLYDPLLDDYEIGMQTLMVQEIFDVLLPAQLALLEEIREREPIDDSLLHQPFDRQKQWDFGMEVIEAIGFSFEHGRQDQSLHPFTTNASLGDVRITTRIQPDYFNAAFFATLHEAGHGLYDQGVHPGLSRTLLAEGTSLGIHESQSRLWENLVGRSRPFWVWAFPKLQAAFPGPMEGVGLEEFYRAVNKVQPNFIRVESDEATYNLHIMLRFELEVALLSGDLTVQDLPLAWNDKMQAYLGLTPPNDSLGVLQDIHWSEGLIGYFPTYLLGNLVACQFWQVLENDVPDLTRHIEAGEFAPMLGWLREKVHRHGAKFMPLELVEKVTGGGLSAEPYLDYLRAKFGEIYSLG